MALPYYKHVDLGIDLTPLTELVEDIRQHTLFETNSVFWVPETDGSVTYYSSDPSESLGRKVHSWTSLGHTQPPREEDLGTEEYYLSIFPYFADEPIVEALWHKLKHICPTRWSNLDGFYASLYLSCQYGRKLANTNGWAQNPINQGRVADWTIIIPTVITGAHCLHFFDGEGLDANLIASVPRETHKVTFHNSNLYQNNLPKDHPQDTEAKTYQMQIILSTDSLDPDYDTLEKALSSFDPESLSD